MRAGAGWLLLFAALCSCTASEAEGEEGEASSAPDPSCASGERWTGGNAESSLMQPGRTCISCHQAQGEGPRFDVAGTVYGADHEESDCYGVAGAQIVLTDHDGRAFTLKANSAGNFSHRGAITFPLQASVVHGGASRTMALPVPNGDCNSCHTAAGEQGAPGRIIVP
jgi:hypothetical protein